MVNMKSAASGILPLPDTRLNAVTMRLRPGDPELLNGIDLGQSLNDLDNALFAGMAFTVHTNCDTA